MVLYLSIIGIAIIVLSLINILCNLVAYSPIITILIVVGGVLFQFAVDGLLAFLVHLMPNKCFELDNKFYAVSNKERKFYEKIKIRKWKDKVWELGSLGGFSKKSLKSSNDIQYIKRFIIESNKGVLTHILGCFTGFLLIVAYLPFSCILSISLPISIINFLINLPSLFILRYNTPKLLAGYKRLLRNEEAANKANNNNSATNLTGQANTTDEENSNFNIKQQSNSSSENLVLENNDNNNGKSDNADAESTDAEQDKMQTSDSDAN